MGREKSQNLIMGISKPCPKCSGFRDGSLTQNVADTTHSLNEALFVIGFEFQAQVADVNFNDVGITYEVIIPNLF